MSLRRRTIKLLCPPRASLSRDMGQHRRNRRPRKSHRPQLGGVLTLVLCSQQAVTSGTRVRTCCCLKWDLKICSASIYTTTRTESHDDWEMSQTFQSHHKTRHIVLAIRARYRRSSILLCVLNRLHGGTSAQRSTKNPAISPQGPPKDEGKSDKGLRVASIVRNQSTFSRFSHAARRKARAPLDPLHPCQVQG